MPDKPKPFINTHLIMTPANYRIQPNRPNRPTTILSSQLPNTTPISQPTSILIPTTTSYSNTPYLISSDLPNTTSTETESIKDNTMTYVIIGALVVGFIILQNKDI